MGTGEIGQDRAGAWLSELLGGFECGVFMTKALGKKII